MAVITGCSSGIGLETALCMSRKGFRTIATMRNPRIDTKLNNTSVKENLPLEIMELDVSKEMDISNLFNLISKTRGRIDILINNSGYGLLGSIEDISMNQIKEQFATNVFGIACMIKYAIPLMRKSGGGKIINISSTNGLTGYPLFSAYNSSKFALEGLIESIYLDLRMKNEKIYPILLEFGPTNTRFAENIILGLNSSSKESVYYNETKRRIKRTVKMTSIGLDPRYIAQILYDVSCIESPSLRYFVNKDGLHIPIRNYKLTKV